MQADPPTAQRIFVVGVPRSGTTLVQSLLAAHSTMTSFTESHFFSRHFSLLPLFSGATLTRDPLPRLQEFLRENGEEPSESAAWFAKRGRLRWRVLLPWSTRAAARKFLQVLDELAQRRGKSNWIEKTPRHLHYIPLIEGASEGGAQVHFVHVIREGLETVASLHKASQSWEYAYDLPTCVQRWNVGVSLSLKRLKESPIDHCVFYEELTAQPEKVLRRLLGGLGLTWESELLERYAHTADGLVTQEESWKHGVGRRIHRSQTSQRELTAEQRKQVTQSLQPNLYDQVQKCAQELSAGAHG